MEIRRKIIWDDLALNSLANTLDWISRDSIQQAELVEKAVLKMIDKASLNPERFPTDKYKKDNKGSFRAFETHSLRISYLMTDTEIQVLRVRHVRQKPLSY